MKKDIGTLASQIYNLLKDQDPEESIKIINSVSTLLGINLKLSSQNSTGNNGQATPSGNPPAGNAKNAKEFFILKKPTTKGEEFAIAAKFRIDNNLGETHTREDFKEIIKNQAKRSFDDGNFHRDIDNAIRAAKFFISHDNKGHYILSSVGENYVDALPDRTAAKAARKETKGGKKRAKKGAAKKSAKK